MELLKVLFLVTFSGFRYAQSVQYGTFPEDGIFNAQVAHRDCVQRGGTLPHPQNEEENEKLRQFLVQENVASVWLDMQRTLFPWLERKSGVSDTRLTYQGCFVENPSFTERYYEDRRSFTLSRCQQTCLSSGHELSAVKGKSRNTWKADTISCMCSSSLQGAVQVSRTRCPYKCDTYWCRVDRQNKPDLLVYNSNSVGRMVNWKNDDTISLSNTDSCGLYTPTAGGTGEMTKASCRSKAEVICISGNGTDLLADSAMYWPNAYQFCAQSDSRLPTLIESKTVSSNKPFWTSISAFHWTTLSGGPFVYSNYGPTSPPLTSDKACSVLTNTGYWRESPCTLNLQIVCQTDNDGDWLTAGPPGEWSTGLPNTTDDGGPAILSHSGRLSTGAIAGVVVGVILGVVIIVGVVLLFIVACSHKEKYELPRTTRHSRIYRASTENSEYMSMSGMVSTVSSQPYNHTSVVPNGRSVSTVLGSDNASESPGYVLAKAVTSASRPTTERSDSYLSVVSNDVYDNITTDSHLGNGEAVYEDPNLNRRPTLCPDEEQDGYVGVEADDTVRADDIDTTGRQNEGDSGVPCATPIDAYGKDNYSYQPDRGRYSYDVPESVDPAALTPPPSPTYGNISSPDVEEGPPEPCQHIYVNA